MTSTATATQQPTHRTWASEPGTPDNPHLSAQARQQHHDLVADLVELRRVSGWHCGTVADLLRNGQPEAAQARLDQLWASWLRRQH